MRLRDKEIADLHELLGAMTGNRGWRWRLANFLYGAHVLALIAMIRGRGEAMTMRAATQTNRCTSCRKSFEDDAENPLHKCDSCLESERVEYEQTAKRFLEGETLPFEFGEDWLGGRYVKITCQDGSGLEFDSSHHVYQEAERRVAANPLRPR